VSRASASFLFVCKGGILAQQGLEPVEVRRESGGAQKSTVKGLGRRLERVDDKEKKEEQGVNRVGEGGEDTVLMKGFPVPAATIHIPGLAAQAERALAQLQHAETGLNGDAAG
jgi:hypothetical protein